MDFPSETSFLLFFPLQLSCIVPLGLLASLNQAPRLTRHITTKLTNQLLEQLERVQKRLHSGHSGHSKNQRLEQLEQGQKQLELVQK